MSDHMKESKGTHAAGAHAAPGKHTATGASADTAPDATATTGAEPTRKKKTLPIVIALIVCLAVAAGGGAFLLNQYLSAEKQSSLADPLAETTEEEDEGDVEEEDELEANPVDFVTLQAEYPELIAWIAIPNTDINYPIMQSITDDNYYLNHDIDGNYSVLGALFTQSMNSIDFTDPVTLIYGHNASNGTFFAGLHNFADEEFFEENEYFYIYTPGHILTYQIISAYRYDDRHIMNSFDFSDESVLADYFESVLNPTSILVNVREGATLDISDRIVQLSTCPKEGSSSGFRYLVTGVLVDDQETL